MDYARALKSWLPKAGTYEEGKQHGRSYYHLKLDGYCCVIHKPGGKQPVVLTKNGTDITADMLWHPLYDLATRLPADTLVAGELWKPGHTSSDVKTAINEQDPELLYHVFSVPTMPPAALLETVHVQATAWGYAFIAYYREQPYKIRALPPNVEGYVLKNGNTKDFLKWKPTKTIDLIVTGYVPGNGKYRGLLGALQCCTTEGDEVASVSGMTDQQRRHYTHSSLIGKVVEVAYDRIGNKGRLIFPRFLRVRDDKDVDECSMCQDPALESYWL